MTLISLPEYIGGVDISDTLELPAYLNPLNCAYIDGGTEEGDNWKDLFREFVSINIQKNEIRFTGTGFLTLEEKINLGSDALKQYMDSTREYLMDRVA